MDASEMFLNQPMPGESMTSELGKYPFDSPPLIAVTDAMILKKYSIV